MGIPTRNSHQSIEEADHHIEPECEEIPPPGDMSSPILTTPMFVDGMHVEASPSHPRTCACHQQGVDDKLVSKKCRRNSRGANNFAIALSSFTKSSNKIKIL
jgi:hypothetical protein